MAFVVEDGLERGRVIPLPVGCGTLGRTHATHMWCFGTPDSLHDISRSMSSPTVR